VTDTFDAVSMMSTHVLSHAPSPFTLLGDIRERLIRGGLLFVDEKDVTKVAAGNTVFPCQYQPGIVHYHHLTLNSAKALIENAGFDILHADYSSLATSLRHFVIVARKRGDQARVNGNGIVADDPAWLYRRMLMVYLTTRYRGTTVRLRNALRRVLGTATYGQW
jgi:hypothetical protein